MKWTSGIFSIAMLTRHNMANPDYKLDGNDQMILEDMWYMIPRSECIPLNDQSEPVSDKCRKNKTESKLWYIDDEDGYRYYNIRYKTIAQDLPNLDLEERAINRRVDKYVASHLLIKKVIRSNVNGGKYSYFQFTSAFLALIYDAENPYHRINPMEETTAESGDNVTSCEEQKESVITDEPSASVTEEGPTNQKYIGEGPTNQIAVGGGPTDKNDVGSGTYEPEVHRSILEEEPTNQKYIGGEPTDSNGSRPTNQNDVAPPVPTDSNGGRPIMNDIKLYSNINYNSKDQPSLPSPKTTESAEKPVQKTNTDIPENKAGRPALIQKIINKFGFEPRFQFDLWSSIQRPFEKKGISMEYAGQYAEWLYEYLEPKCKNPNSFTGFFGIAWQKDYNIDRWWNQAQTQIQREKAATLIREQNQIACPVCGCVHDRDDDACPYCKTSSDMLADEQDLKVARDVWQLKQSAPDKADAYFAEITDASADMMSPDWMRLSAEDRMQAREEMNKAINEIHSKYFVAITA